MNKFLLDIIQLQVVQIILVAYIGALLGEVKKEVDDDDAVNIGKFLITWLCSGFGGVMVGLLLQGTVAKDNNYVVLGASGIAGFAGQQKSIGIATKLINVAINNSDTDTKKKKSTRKTTKKKDDKDDST
jgi:hypothetical protein